MTTGAKFVYELDQNIETSDGKWPSGISEIIMEEGILLDAIHRFIKKQVDYGNSANDLGMAGQYSEMHRKMGKLRRAMWEGKPLTDESLKEVLEDLFGHVLLALTYEQFPNLVLYAKGASDVRR